ncbi:MAG: hypothetical protein LUQ32_10035 [Methanomicrobiales archaeon]|nr:hypothetical protein [Methanomicrobiales archaeon]
MKPRRSLLKLLLGSVIAGVIIRYAAPAGADPVPLIGQFLRELIINHTLTTVQYAFFNVNTLLWLIILLLIALVPFMFALFSGVWGFLTYLGGFLTGYLLTPDYWFVGILCFAVGLMSALYGEFIKG